MSVSAECFKVDIGVSAQATWNTFEKDNNQIVKEYLEKLKIKSKESIGEIPYKNVYDSFVEVISVDEDSIFGIIGRSNRVEESVMRRVMGEDGEPVTSTEFNWQDYRFFVLDLMSLRCAVIKNSPAPKFQKLFSDFLYSHKTHRISHVNAIPVIDHNINKKLKRYKQVSKIDMIFTSDSSLQKQIISVEDLFDISESSLVKSSLSLELKSQTISEDLRNFVNKKDLIEYEFDKLELTVGDESRKKETLEFAKRLLTLNVDIEIDYDSLVFSKKYFDPIKKALLESLNTI